MLSPSLQSARRVGCEVMVLVPPYRTMHAPNYTRHAVPPLGTVFCGDGPDTLAALAELTLAVHQWPWVIPCIVARSGGESVERLLMLVSELRDRLAVVKQRRDRPLHECAAVMAAVRNRTVPDARTLTAYYCGRVLDARLREAVADQFRHALSGSSEEIASASTYSRVFAQFGSYTARDWRAIARMCVHCAGQGSWEGNSQLPMRTAHHYLKKYVGMPYHALTDHVGWEWFLEEALRVGKYLGDR